MRQCTITLTPDNKSKQMDVTTGDVTTLEIIDMLKSLSSVFAKQLCEEYKQFANIEHTAGIDDDEFDEYVKFLRANTL